MPAGHGLRSRTRDTFSRGFRQKGYINLTTYLRSFRLGDYVDIKVNGAVHKVSGVHTTHLCVCFRQSSAAAADGHLLAMPAGWAAGGGKRPRQCKRQPSAA